MAIFRQPLGAGSHRAILAWLSEEIGLDSLYVTLVFWSGTRFANTRGA
jgi:hypothetical protein